MDSPFHDTSTLLSAWRDPNLVQGEEVLVAEMDGRIVGCVTVEDRGRELELVNIDVPLELQGRGDRHDAGAVSRRASQSSRKAGSHRWHESERRRHGLEITSLVATPRVPSHSRRGEPMDPVNRARCTRDTNAEGPPARIRSSAGPRTVEEIIGASLDVAGAVLGGARLRHSA